MLPTNIPAAESTDDCDIMYEKVITSSIDSRTKVGSTRDCCSTCQITQGYHHCSCQLTEFGYPKYAAKELALFQDLEARRSRCPETVRMKVRSEEPINLEIEITHDNEVTSANPEKESDSMDCEILWVKYKNSSGSRANESKDSQTSLVDSQQSAERNYNLRNTPREKLNYGTIGVPRPSIPVRLTCSKPDVKPTEVTNNTKDKPRVYNICQICSISVPSMFDLKDHLTKHVDETKTVAQVHKESIIALQQLDYKARAERSKSRAVCTICKKVFSNRTDLKQHRNTFHDHGRPYQCELCPKNYTRRSHLTRHQIIHWDKF